MDSTQQGNGKKAHHGQVKRVGSDVVERIGSMDIQHLAKDV